ncbi:hypothetical protein [Phenylobacterium sp.]|uniref:hypothetical protein n=1 Tax=Phenylobacterium sp. TaxID=1871053 RepID=UPI00271B68B1|nr:hypothetical protein [Phenylobacterium sp.]MDO8798956.1 hypothetical protein [Phenylobacterium sp.]
MTNIPRTELFEDAWKRPLSTIAAEFGISDTALRKICDRHDIPTPGRGYWAKVTSGQTLPKPKLRPAKSPELEVVGIYGAIPRSAEMQAAIAQVRAERPTVERPVRRKTMPTESSVEPLPADVPEAEIHPLAVRTHAKLAGAADRDPGLVRLSGKGLFTVTASPAQADRVCRLLTQLLTACEAKGWTAKSDEKAIALVPDGEPIHFEITEQTDRVRHQVTEAEAEVLRKHEERKQRAARRGDWFSDYDRPKIPEWDSVPNGQLALSLVAGYRQDGMRRKYSDGKTQRLEGLIDRVIEALAIYAASEKVWRERQERERLEAIEVEKRRRELERVVQLEEHRLAFLKHQVQRHRRALEVEAFVVDTEAAGAAEGVVAEFLRWAKGYAAVLRDDISPEVLRRKLERLNLMSNDAKIDSWRDIDHPLDAEKSQGYAYRRDAPWWLLKRD